MKLFILIAVIFAFAQLADSAPFNLFGLNIGSKDKSASVDSLDKADGKSQASIAATAGTNKDKQPAGVAVSAGSPSKDKPAVSATVTGKPDQAAAGISAAAAASSKDKPALPSSLPPATGTSKQDKPSAAVLPAAAAASADASDFPGPKIQFAALKKGLDEKKLTVFDVRSPESIAANGKVPGTFNVPFGEVEDAFTKISKEEFRSKYGFERPSPPGDNVVVMCHGGGTAKRAIQILHKYGYKNLIWYEGSFVDWLANNGPVIKTAAQPVPEGSGKSSDSIKPALPLTKPALPLTKPALHEQSLDNLPDAHLGEPAKIEFQQLKAGLEAKKYTVIDVRPLSMVQENGGNLPGAFNVPLNEVEFAFKNMTEAEFKTKYGFNRPSKPGTNVVITCKIGKTARIALSMLRPLGYTDMLWYEGSFDDWKAKGGPIEKFTAPAGATDQKTPSAITPDTTKQTKPVPAILPAVLPVAKPAEKSPETKPASVGKDSPAKPSAAAVDGKATVKAPGAVDTALDANADPRRDNKFQVQTRPADISDVLLGTSKQDGTDDKRPSLETFSVKVVMFNELKRLQDESETKLVIVDMSSKDEFKKKHIKGSVNLPIEELSSLSKLTNLEFHTKYGFAKPKPPGRNLVLTARSGCGAFKAVHKAMSRGGSSLMWYVPGVDDWIANKGPIEGTEATDAQRVTRAPWRI